MINWKGKNNWTAKYLYQSLERKLWRMPAYISHLRSSADTTRAQSSAVNSLSDHRMPRVQRPPVAKSKEEKLWSVPPCLVLAARSRKLRLGFLKGEARRRHAYLDVMFFPRISFVLYECGSIHCSNDVKKPDVIFHRGEGSMILKINRRQVRRIAYLSCPKLVGISSGVVRQRSGWFCASWVPDGKLVNTAP